MQVVYFGKAHDDPLEFFQKFGHVCEPNFNPADFYSTSNCQSCSFSEVYRFCSSYNGWYEDNTDRKIQMSVKSSGWTQLKNSSRASIDDRVNMGS